VSTPRIEPIQFDRNRLEVFAAGRNSLPNSPGFEPHALRERARFTVPERSTPGASQSKTLVSADSIRNFKRTEVGSSMDSMDREFLTPKQLRVTFAEKQRGNSIFLDDDRNGALKQSNRNDQMVLILDPQENALRPHKWTCLKADTLPRS
jgi:hypothetical protein